MSIASLAARALALLAALVVSHVQGHPAPQGGLHATFGADAVRMRATVAREEVSIGLLYLDKRATTEGRELQGYAAYLARHIHVAADGRALKGRVLRAPATLAESPLVFELEYAYANGPPQELAIRQDSLREFLVAPGNRWEARYLFSVEPASGATTPVLLTFDLVATVRCGQAMAAVPADGHLACTVDIDAYNLFVTLFLDGIKHILAGYDHLLFVAALLLAAATLLDLVKVVGVFTLAHTVTLALATFGVVRLDPAIIEPVIAASIVAVAAQNLFWPRQSRGFARLAAAFGFGLFHGLGFAGGLAEAMQTTSGTDLAYALMAFSLGVESGHMLVVLPLFAMLAWLRHSRGTESFRRHVVPGASAVVGMGGVYFLAMVLASQG